MVHQSELSFCGELQRRKRNRQPWPIGRCYYL